MSQALRVAWYRFRSTLGDRWGGYLALVLLVGLIGGLALGAVAAARRTQAAFPAYLASTDPTDLTVLTGVEDPAADYAGYDPALIRKIATLPHVRRVESYAGLNAAILAPNGAVAVDYSGPAREHRRRVLHLRSGHHRPGPDGRSRPRRRGRDRRQRAPRRQVHVGEVVPLGFYTNAQEALPDFGRPGIKPYLRIDVKVVGKAVFSREVTQDDADTQLNGGALFTPALTRLLARCCASFTESAVQLDGGAGQVAATEADIERILPKGFPVEFYVTSLTEAKAERAIEPASIALAVFGAIAALAGLLIAGQVIGRQLRLAVGDLDILRALGAGPAVTAGDGLPGVLCAVVAGSLLAAAVAVGLSPLAPLGSVRAVYPYRGIAFDWTVLGAGVLTLIGVLSLVAVTLAYRRAPHRAGRRQQARVRGSAAVRAASASGLPPPAVEGIRLALDPGTGRNAVPVRSAILGAALAVTVMIATVTFGASLGTLVSHPALYGWNWTYALCSCGSSTYIPRQRAAALLDHDPAVAAWTGIYFATFKVDGLTVPVIGASPNAPVGPPLLSGHGLAAAGQVVLGPATLAQLHKRIGDEVTVLNGAVRRSRLRIVGTATLPSLGVWAPCTPRWGSERCLPIRLSPVP